MGKLCWSVNECFELVTPLKEKTICTLTTFQEGVGRNMSVMRVFEIKSFYFGIIFDSEKSCKDSTESSCTPLIQVLGSLVGKFLNSHRCLKSRESQH